MVAGGCGAWRIAEWTRGQRDVMSRNDGFVRVASTAVGMHSRNYVHFGIKIGFRP